MRARHTLNLRLFMGRCRMSNANIDEIKKALMSEDNKMGELSQLGFSFVCHTGLGIMFSDNTGLLFVRQNDMEFSYYQKCRTETYNRSKARLKE